MAINIKESIANAQIKKSSLQTRTSWVFSHSDVMCNCKSTLRKPTLIIFIIGLFSCSQRKSQVIQKTVDIQKTINIDNDDFLETLYHRCDTVIETKDTLKIINSKFDTIIIETGIFTFLQYDYPLTTPHTLVNQCKMAVQFESKGQHETAIINFNNMVYFYLNDRPEQLKGFSDMNGYLQYEVNSAILCSYAYEKIGDNESALKILQPFLANVEAWDSKIHERYIQLCIDKYGIDKVRTELNNCGKTIILKKQESPEKDDWVVNVFGADIGVGKAWLTDQISIAQADSLVRQMDFYILIQ